MQRLMEEQECQNLLSQCHRQIRQFRTRSQQMLDKERNIDQMIDSMLLGSKKLNKQTQLFKFQYCQETNNNFKY